MEDVTNTQFARFTGFRSTLSPSRPRPFLSTNRVLVTILKLLDRISGVLPSAEGGEERLAERSRSETPPPSTDGSTPLMRSSRTQIVTSTRFAQRNGRGREGERADRKPVERANRVLVTAG